MPDVIPLTCLKRGTQATVADVRGIDYEKKLTAFGIVPGAVVKVVQRFPAYVIQMDFTELALDVELAGSILVYSQQVD